MKFTRIPTLNKEMYIDILHRLRNAFRKKRPGNWRANSLFLLHDNAPAHRSVLDMDFLAKNNVTILEHPPNSPDFAPADSDLIPPLKSVFRGWSFRDASDIIKNATEELKSLS
jgi:transposase